MSTLLTESDSHALYNDAMETLNLQQSFAIVQGTGAKFGYDGDHYYYGFGSLPEPDAIYGFGKTPREALQKFASAYYSQQIKNNGNGK